MSSSTAVIKERNKTCSNEWSCPPPLQYTFCSRRHCKQLLAATNRLAVQNFCSLASCSFSRALTGASTTLTVTGAFFLGRQTVAMVPPDIVRTRAASASLSMSQRTLLLLKYFSLMSTVCAVVCCKMGCYTMCKATIAEK